MQHTCFLWRIVKHHNVEKGSNVVKQRSGASRMVSDGIPGPACHWHSCALFCSVRRRECEAVTGCRWSLNYSGMCYRVFGRISSSAGRNSPFFLNCFVFWWKNPDPSKRRNLKSRLYGLTPQRPNILHSARSFFLAVCTYCAARRTNFLSGECANSRTVQRGYCKLKASRVTLSLWTLFLPVTKPACVN